MKTLTVKQPWASLIVKGIKDIENRTWKTKFRGRILIHASAKIAGSRLDSLNQEQFDVLVDKNNGGNYDCSSIIGSVEIVDCVINHESIWAEKSPEFTTNRANQEGFKPIYNWVLANPIKFEQPIENVKGKLSLWEYDIESIPSL
tara:strand:- start:26335 stop:26769 length:435 start_codon:yes stop_codon:yes gene_type:complete